MRFFIIFFYIFCVSQALRWTKYQGGLINTESVISMMNAKTTPQIDVSSGTQMTIIRNTKLFERGVYIYCFISGYSDKFPIEYSFCKNKECYKVTDGTNQKITNFNLNLNITTNFTNQNQKGMKIGLQLPNTNNDFSGNYYCVANNNNFAIQSNYIEIRDTVYWGNNLFTTVNTVERTNVKLIGLKELPQVLNCSDGTSVRNPTAPIWTKIEFFSPVQWSVCPVLKTELAQAEKSKMTTGRCLMFSKTRCEDTIAPDICPTTLNKMSDWSTYVNQGGDLIFTELRVPSNTNIDSYTFMCYTKDTNENLVALFYYYDTVVDGSISKGISFDPTTPSTIADVTMISPQKQTFEIYARQIPTDMDISSVKPVAIYALFKSPTSANSIWKQNGVTLNSNQQMTVGKYSVTFLRDVTSDQAGEYTLDVTNGPSKVTMTINVKVLGPPIIILDACMPPLFYKWAGENVQLTCQYKQRPTDLSMLLNNQVIKLSDPLENSKAVLKMSNPYLEQLSFTMSPTNFVVADQVSVTYSANNLTKSLGQSQYQDHTVTFVASNDFGISVKSTSIYVLPFLRDIVTAFPEKYNCTNPCSSGMPHKFKCEVRLEEYANKELRVEQYWTINSNKLGAANTDPANVFARYFQVDPITKELTMLPIISNDTASDKFVKDALKKNFIECHVDLYPLNKVETDFSYTSTLDKTLGTSMQASITLDYEPINTAYVYWIVAVILGLIVLVIIIVLLTRYCMKNKGDVYQLDKLERAHGYDPDKEVQEELFKPYERQEHDPENMIPDSVDGKRMSITGHSMGSNDNGDLDSYEIDASNFNEDGSLVGKYASNPRDRAAMT